MAAMGNSSVKSQRISRNLSRALALAFLEWLLIFLLFMDAIFAYLITRFARYCELQTPCLLCSRLDHVLENKRLKHYWDLICSSHRLEISSLVASCNSHNKLIDGCGRSERCNKPQVSEEYSRRLIETESTEFKGTNTRRRGIDHLTHVGYKELKVNSDSESEIVSSDDDDNDARGLKRGTGQPKSVTLSDDSVLEKLIDPVSAPEPSLDAFNEISHTLDAYETSVVIDASEESKPIKARDIPLSFKEMETPSEVEIDGKVVSADAAMTSSTAVEATKENSAINTNSIELKETTLLESEVICKDETMPSTLEESKLKTETINSECANFESSVTYPLSHVGYRELKVTSDSEFEDFSFDDDGDDAGHELIEDIRPKIVSLSDVLVLEKLIDPISAFAPSNSMEAPVDVVKESKLTFHHEITPSVNVVETSIVVDASQGSKAVPANDCPSLSNEIETTLEVSNDEKYIFFLDVTSSSTVEESSVAVPQESCVTESVETKEASFTECEVMYNAEAVPNTSEEAATEKNPVRGDTYPQNSYLLDLSDAYKVAVSTRGRQLSGSLAEHWIEKDKSSRISEDLKLLLSQLSATRGGFEQAIYDMSPKVSINNDELKAFDTNGMQILQKRTSLERNESGLESLDGISIVSEIEGESLVDRLKRQVDHDKKLLSALYKELEEERNASAVAVNQAMAMITRLQEEKASLNMEALQNIRMMEEQAEYDMEALQKTNDLLAAKEKEIQDLEAELEFYGNKCEKESEMVENLEKKDTLLELEDERLCILRRLKKLEKKLYLFAYNGLSLDLGNGTYSENEGDEQEDTSTSKVNTEFDLSSLGKEILDLNERLEALEADQNFLELTINSLKNRKDSVGFIQEIASHLRELRKIGIRRD